MSDITRRVIDTQRLNAAIGRIIRRERARRHLTHTDVGGILGIGRTSVCNMEAGRQQILLVHLYNLAFAWRIPVTRFLPEVR